MPDRQIDSRHLARLLALQVLYEADGSDHDALTIAQTYANITTPSNDARAASYMALHVVYQDETDEADWGEDDNLVLDDVQLVPNHETYQLLVSLINGVEDQIHILDQIIITYAPEWPLDQLAIIDRNILRIALYEIFFGKNAPIKVIINEAVRLAKLYGSETSSSFINGVLGGIAEDRDNIEKQIKNIDTPSDS